MLTIYLAFYLVGQKLCYLGMGGFNRASMDGDNRFHEWLFVDSQSRGQLKAFPKFGVLVSFYSLGIIYPIKCSHGRAFPLNSVFLGSVSSLVCCRRNSSWIIWELSVLFQIRLKLAESSRNTACTHWDYTSICLRQKKKIKFWITAILRFFFLIWSNTLAVAKYQREVLLDFLH